MYILFIYTHTLLYNTQWIHYTSCSTLPLVTDERAVNTYISILKEQQKCSSLNSSFDKLSDLYKVLFSLPPICININTLLVQLLGEASKDGNGIDMNPNNKLVSGVGGVSVNINLVRIYNEDILQHEPIWLMS